MDDYDKYIRGVWILAVPVFLVGWGYAIAQYGFFLGAGLGWIPAALLAAIAGFLWPLLAFLLGVGAIGVGGFMMWQITHP